MNTNKRYNVRMLTTDLALLAQNNIASILVVTLCLHFFLSSSSLALLSPCPFPPDLLNTTLCTTASTARTTNISVRSNVALVLPCDFEGGDMGTVHGMEAFRVCDERWRDCMRRMPRRQGTALRRKALCIAGREERYVLSVLRRARIVLFREPCLPDLDVDFL